LFTSDVALGFPSGLLSVSSDGFFPFSRFSGEDVNSESRVSTNDSGRKMSCITSSADGDLDRAKRTSWIKKVLDEQVDSRTCKL